LDGFEEQLRGGLGNEGRKFSTLASPTCRLTLDGSDQPIDPKAREKGTFCAPPARWAHSENVRPDRTNKERAIDGRTEHHSIDPRAAAIYHPTLTEAE